LLLVYTDAIKNYFETFIQTKSVDEASFIETHKNIFENIVSKKEESGKPKHQLVSLNALAVGLPPLLIKNLLKNASNFDLHISYASNSVNALERVAKEKYQLVLSSYFIEPLNGVSLCAAIKLQWPKSEIKFILFPSQDVELPSEENFGRICPDKIILKDQDMYSEFTKYLEDLFIKNKQIKKIAFLDDDKNILDLYRMTFDDLDEVEKLYIDPESNIKEELIKFKPDLIISDVNMPNVEILNLLKLFTDKGSNSMDFIFVTGDSKSPYCKKLLEFGAKGILEKSSITSDLIEQCESLGYQIKIKK
jgi:DNA-binding NarL/FixJ family response regulator